MEDLTAVQAAILTGLSERTIRRKIATGAIAARKVGPNRFAIKPDDLPVQQHSQSLTWRVRELEQRVLLLEEREAQHHAQARTPEGESLFPLAPLMEEPSATGGGDAPDVVPTPVEGQ